jgi:hypothetical protein
MNVDAGGSGVMSRSNHWHWVDVSISGETGGVGNHSHSFSGSGSGGISNDGGQLITGTTGGQTAPVTGTADSQSNVPPFVDVVFCQKN